MAALHPTLRLLFIGARDTGSALSALDDDVIRCIWQPAWRELVVEKLRAAFDAEEVVLAHVDNIKFPSLQPLQPLNCNMMPFVLGDKESLPRDLWGYWPLVQTCAGTLPRHEQSKVCYLTVHESIVTRASQRRPGLHTEGFMCEDAGGSCKQAPYWHRWGFGTAMRPGKFSGGISSTVTPRFVSLLRPRGAARARRQRWQSGASEVGTGGAAAPTAAASTRRRARRTRRRRLPRLRWCEAPAPGQPSGRRAVVDD